jgi:hypothetical protein
MQKQIVVIHGGDSYETREKFLDVLKKRKVTKGSFFPKSDWKSNLQKDLGDEYEVLSPRMPNKQNARYDEWKAWFERAFPFVENGVILVGHSMGGLFLAKHLSENKFPRKISAFFLVAPVYRDAEGAANFPITADLKKAWEQCPNIHIFQSEDDPLVAMSEVEEYQKAWPDAKRHAFQNRGHFNQETFPEIVEEIKKAGK